MGLSSLSANEVAAWVAASCAAQGVPIKVTDPTVIRRVGALLGAAEPAGRARKRSGTRPAGVAGSVAPHDGHAGGVQDSGTGGAGSDHRVVDQGCDDGVLAREVQGVPGAA